MSKVKTIALITLRILAAVLILVSLVSTLYNNISAWWIKSLNFPRIQFFVLSAILMILFLPFLKKGSRLNRIFFTGLLISAGIHLWFFLPYTFLWQTEVASAGEQPIASKAKVALLVSNVYMKNRNVAAVKEVVQSSQADLVFLVETNRWWIQSLEGLKQDYQYTVEYPLDNTYGFVLFSKFPLQNTEIMFLKNDSVPSVHTLVELPNGRRFHFYGVHPVPPFPSRYPDNVGEKAGALERLAQQVLKQKGPVVVAGDFNDVAWSETNRVFKDASKLKDVRTGRGFFNSFDAKSAIMRWPLDHVFVTPDFRLLEIDRLSKIGSDHFPVYFQLALPNGSKQ